MEVLILGVRRAFFDHRLTVGSHVVWMAPVGYFLAAMVVVIPVALLSRVAGRSLAPVGMGIVGVLLGAALGFNLPWLADWAVTVLAVGVGVQLVRSEAVVRRLAARRTVLVVGGPAILVALLTSGVLFVGWKAERDRFAAIPGAPGGMRNIVLLVLDTAGAQWMSLYGYPLPTTPGLGALAAEATVFDRAISTAPWTLPSHASMFTGRYPHEMRVGWWDPVDQTVPTLAQELAGAGYLTAGFVANYAFANPEFGLSRGFAHYDTYPVTWEEVLFGTAVARKLLASRRARSVLGLKEIINRKTATEVNAEFLAWLDRHPRRPFFAFLNYFDNHQPYLPPAPFDSLFDVPERSVHPRTQVANRIPGIPPEVRRRMAPAEQGAERRAYEATLAYVDRELDRLLQALRSRGILDQTLLVVTSDHGEDLGDGGRFLHGRSLHYPTVHVPLLLRLPGEVPAGLRVPRAVSLRDLPATIVDLAGLQGRVEFPGASLAGAWREGEPAVLSPALSVFEGPEQRRLPQVSLVRDALHLIRYDDGRVELYDIGRDPRALDDTWESSGRSPAALEMLAALDAMAPRTAVRGAHEPGGPP